MRTRLIALVLVVAATLGSTAPVDPSNRITLRITWAVPLEPAPFDCDNKAYARNNPDKCGLPGPFLLGGGAPRGRGIIGSILHGLTGGLL
jgi:hypothetical protein